MFQIGFAKVSNPPEISGMVGSKARVHLRPSDPRANMLTTKKHHQPPSCLLCSALHITRTYSEFFSKYIYLFIHLFNHSYFQKIKVDHHTVPII